MEFNIQKLFEQRKSFAITSKSDEMIDDVLEKNTDRFFIITPEGQLLKYLKNGMLKSYYITATFDMNTVFSPSTQVHFNIYIFSKKEPKMIKIGRYLDDLKFVKKQKTNSKSSEFITTEDLPNQYADYCFKIEQWVNKGITPDDTEYYDFNLVPVNSFDTKKPYLRKYTKQAIAIQNKIKNEKTVQLDEVAKILRSNKTNCENHKAIYYGDCSYPLNKQNIRVTNRAGIKLITDDIILFPNGKMYLFKEEAKDFYSSTMSIVIRPKSILPEYLYLYLISDTAQILFDAHKQGSVIERISTKDLSSIPVVLPKNSEEMYKQTFQTMYYGTKSANEIYKSIDELSINENTIEGIFNEELMRKMQFVKDKNVAKMLTEDIEEINSCYKVKAYKATLILAGSVLEAFLIDWLSEIEHRNYFNVEYVVPGKKHPELYDYINAISEIKKPEWMIESQNAHEIRTKRNLVHAKLCLKKSNEINDETCKKVIEYLSGIIETRYPSIG